MRASRSPVILALCGILLLVPSGALAAPSPSEGAVPSPRDVDEIVRRREELRREYDERAEARSAALRAAADSVEAPKDRIPGWSEDVVPTASVATPAPTPGTPPTTAPGATPAAPDPDREVPIALVLIATCAALAAGIAFFAVLLRRRNPAGAASSVDGPATIRLRPLSERIPSRSRQ